MCTKSREGTCPQKSWETEIEVPRRRLAVAGQLDITADPDCGLEPNPNHPLEFSAPTNGPVRSYRYPRDPENPGPALSEND